MEPAEKQEIFKLRLQGLGYKAISKELLLTVDTVKGYCNRKHLNGLMDESDFCLQCRTPIQQLERGRTKKFCSVDCRHTWWSANPGERKQLDASVYSYTCGHCGKQSSSYGNANRKY